MDRAPAGTICRAVHSSAQKRTWMVRAGKATRAAAEFEAKAVVALGRYDVCWNECLDVRAIKEKLAQCASGKSRRQQVATASQIERFLRAIQIGDRVTTYDSSRRMFLLGRIAGGPKHEPTLIEGFPTVRAVRWDGTVGRDTLSQKSLRALRAMSALFLVADSAAAELEAKREPF